MKLTVTATRRLIALALLLATILVATAASQAAQQGSPDAAFAPVTDRRDTGLPLVGFVIGAMLVFVGASLLLRSVSAMRRGSRVVRSRPLV